MYDNTNAASYPPEVLRAYITTLIAQACGLPDSRIKVLSYSNNKRSTASANVNFIVLGSAVPNSVVSGQTSISSALTSFNTAITANGGTIKSTQPGTAGQSQPGTASQPQPNPNPGTTTGIPGGAQQMAVGLLFVAVMVLF